MTYHFLPSPIPVANYVLVSGLFEEYYIYS